MERGPDTAARPAGPDPRPGAKTDFGALFKASARSLWLVAFGVVQDAALAEDVVQEAALVALSKLEEFRPGTNFAAWMARIVQFVARNQVRARRRRRTVGLESAAREVVATQTPATGAELLGSGPLPADQLHFDDRVSAALQRVATVPRMCLMLRTIDGLEYAEISRLLGIPAGTAMSHVHRSRQFLRQTLADLKPPGLEVQAPPS